MDRAKPQLSHLVHGVIVQEMVVAREQVGVFGADPDVDTSLLHRLDGPDVIPVAVGLEHGGDAEAEGHAQQSVVLVGGVDERRLAAPSTAHHVHVVIHWTHHEAVNLAHGVGPDEFYIIHPLTLTRLFAHLGVAILEVEREGREMNFGFSEEQEELRKMVRRFLEEKSPESEVRRLMATNEGYDPAVWTQMANELALQGLGIPEEYGGQGYGPVELYVVFEEMGAALLCSPYFSTVALAVNALLLVGDDQSKSDFLPGLASGETIATVALTDDDGRWDLTSTSTTAARKGGGFVLSGVRNYVTDGSTASLLLVPAMTDVGLSLFAVESDASGVSRELLSTMDQTRKQSRIVFDNAPARLVGEEGAALKGLEATMQIAAAALAAEQVGGAQRVLDSSVEYAKNRVQFGRPIGSFQAIKHKCADMLLDVESAKSAAYYAAWAAQERNDELPIAASLAKSFCSEAYFHCAAENIQIHGGIGFTWEHPAHLYFKRAKSSELFLGDPAYHRELLAQRLGI